jgi:hypothetical protein
MALAMTLRSSRERAQTTASTSGSVPRLGTLHATILVRRRLRLCTEDRVAARSFSRRGTAALVVLSVIRSRNDVVERPPRWSHGFLEPLIAASTFGHYASVDSRPHDRPEDLALTRERSGPIPDRRRERHTQLVVTGPPPEADQLPAFEPAQREPVDPPAPAPASRTPRLRPRGWIAHASLAVEARRARPAAVESPNDNLGGTAGGTASRAEGPRLACADPAPSPHRPARERPDFPARAEELPISAEREGFEPSMDETAHTGFRDRRIQPLCHLSERRSIVGAVGARGRSDAPIASAGRRRTHAAERRTPRRVGQTGPAGGD